MTAKRILFVDDDANILAGYKRSLYKRFEIVTALDGAEGLDRLQKEGPFAVVVADMQMPVMNGVEFLRRAEGQAPETVRLMLTGNADQKTAVDAVNQGHVFSFLTKPCPINDLEAALNNALRQHHLIVAEKELLEQTLNGAIKVLIEVLSITDSQAFGKAQRLREEMRAFAKWFGAARPWEFELGAMLSQIGYVTIPAHLLAKQRSGAVLSAAEREICVRAPETGASLVAKIPRLSAVAEIVRYQNKNFDGSGFPQDGISGEAIPIGARVLRVLSDLVDAESPKSSRAEAFSKIKGTPGAYDPKVLEAVAACHDVYLDQLPAPPPLPKKVYLSDLRVGMILTENVTTKDGVLLVTADTKLSSPLLHKLRNFHDLIGLKEPLFALSGSN